MGGNGVGLWQSPSRDISHENAYPGIVGRHICGTSINRAEDLDRLGGGVDAETEGFVLLALRLLAAIVAALAVDLKRRIRTKNTDDQE